MKVSTRGRYGLRAMLELARCRVDSPVLMSALAEREDISRKYLHAILTSLKTAGLVSSVKGAGGGFVLTRDPSEIRLGDIMRAVEGPLSLVDCVADEAVCDRAGQCVARGVWQELSRTLEGMLDGITLADLITRQKQAGSKRDGSSRPRRPPKRAANSRPSRITVRSQRRKAGTR